MSGKLSRAFVRLITFLCEVILFLVLVINKREYNALFWYYLFSPKNAFDAANTKMFLDISSYNIGLVLLHSHKHIVANLHTGTLVSLHTKNAVFY